MYVCATLVSFRFNPSLLMTLPTAQDLMSSQVLAVRASWTVPQLAAFFTEHTISGAPVVSDDGVLIGVVSLRDVAQHHSAAPAPTDAAEDEPPSFYQQGGRALHVPPAMLGDLEASDVTVRDIMMPTLFCVDADTPANAIADKMLRGRLHRLLVVRPGSRRDVVGIITTLDLLPIIRDLGGSPSS